LEDWTNADTISADLERLIQVVVNLLSNALRYVPAGSHVMVRTQPRDQDVVISVIDDGPGVPPDHLSHLLERFWRMDQ